MEDVTRRAGGLWHWAVPATLTMGAIALSSLPGARVPPMPSWGLDKVIHLVEFMVLTVAWAWAWQAHYRKRLSPAMLAVVFVAMAAFGVVDELYQSLVPGRDCSFYDWLADVIGAIVGVLMFFLYLERRDRGNRAAISGQDARLG